METSQSTQNTKMEQPITTEILGKLSSLKAEVEKVFIENTPKNLEGRFAVSVSYSEVLEMVTYNIFVDWFLLSFKLLKIIEEKFGIAGISTGDKDTQTILGSYQ